jgi:peptidoglycan/LPS O-acetylase OafA/YrhL
MIAAVVIRWPLGLNRYPMMLVFFIAIVVVQLISIAIYYLFEKRSSKLVQNILMPRVQIPSIIAKTL